MRKIKVVQLGLGHDHAIPAINSLYEQNDVFELCGLYIDKNDEYEMDAYEREKDSRPALKNLPLLSFEEALSIPDLDGVVIECEDRSLTKYALLAAEKGLNIHMDKPGGIDTAEYEKLLSVMKKNGKVFHTGYMYRFNPYVIEAIKRVKNGEIGRVYSVEAHMDCEHTPAKRQWLSAYPGGMMYFLGCHLVDLIYTIQGIPDEIHPYCFGTGNEGVTAKDVGFAVFTYKNGCSFAKTSALEPGGFTRRQLVICGEKGTIYLEPMEAFTDKDAILTTDMRIVMEKEGWASRGVVTTSEPYNRYNAMLRDFAEIVCGEKENDFDYEYEARLHRILLCACGEKIDYKEKIEL